MARMVSSVQVVILACLCLTSFPHHANAFISLPCQDDMLIIEEHLSFKDAEARCKAYNYSGLAVLHNQEAQDSFQKAIKDHARCPSADYWVGLTFDHGKFGRNQYRWSNGYVISSGPGPPPLCGKADGKANFTFVNCAERRKSVCADYVDHRNIIVFLKGAQLNQADAAAKCKAKGFQRLAVLNSREKFNYALKARPRGFAFWIGMEAISKTDLRWVTGEKVTWAQWRSILDPDELATKKCIIFRDKGIAPEACSKTSDSYPACENTKPPTCPVHVPVPATLTVKPPCVLHFDLEVLFGGEGLYPKTDSHVISTTQARSLIDCSLICARMNGCESSAYHEESKMCSSLLRQFKGAKNLLEPRKGWTVVDRRV